MKQKVIVMLVMSVMLLGVSGCASSGSNVLKSENKSSIKEKIHIGETSQADVQSMFGAPLSTGLTEHGMEIWKYVFAKMHADAISYVPLVGLFAGSSSGTKKELTILFDKNKKVKQFNMSTVPVNTKTGLLSD